MKTTLSLLTILVVLGLKGLGQAASPESYLPLQEGMVWEFRHTYVDLKNKEELTKAKSIKKNLAPTEAKGVKVYPQLFSFYQPENILKQETKSFIAKDDHGFYVYARQGKDEKEPAVLEETFYILKYPLQKGTSWKQKAEGMLLHNSIEDTKATVKVPAGTFQNCLLLKKLAFQREGDKEPIHETLFWFAPGVGNVKVITKMLDRQRELTQELVSFKK